MANWKICWVDVGHWTDVATADRDEQAARQLGQAIAEQRPLILDGTVPALLRCG